MPPSESEHLSPTAIDSIACGGAPDSSTRDHLRSCNVCREYVQAAREEAAYLVRVRALASPALGPEDAPRVPGYRIIERIGSGAQALVYRAVQTSTARTVAIKLIRGADHNGAGWRAEREAEIAAGLRHPGIVTIFESRTLDDGGAAMVMEYVDGTPIDEWQDPSWTADRRHAALLGVFVRVCEAIHHAHLNGVIHRDIKPDNVLVRKDGNPVVLDFGIARHGDAWRTRVGELTGTPAYASPEQVSGDPDAVDALTDVYSLGVLLYVLLCGRLPYQLDGSILAMAKTIVDTPATPLRSADPTIHKDLDAIVHMALHKDKRRRYQSAAALGAEVERFINKQPVEARGDSGWYLVQRLASRNRRRIAAVVVSVTVLVTASALVVASMADAAAAQRRESQQREQARLDQVRLRAVTELMRLTLPAVDAAHPEIGAAVSAGLGRLYFRLESGAYADEPELDQEIRRLWGGVYTGLAPGNDAKFVEYAEDALRGGLVRLRVETPSGDSPEIAEALHELASVLLVRRRLGEAEQICQQAIEMRGRILGVGHPANAHSIALRARILKAQGRLADASSAADDAITALDAAHSTNVEYVHGEMIAIKAWAALEQAGTAHAADLVLDAMRIRLRRSFPDDPELLDSLGQAARLINTSPDAALSKALRDIWDSPGQSAAVALRRDIEFLRAPSQSFSPGNAPPGRAEAIGRVLRLQERILGPNHPAMVGLLMAQTQAAWAEGSLELRADSLLRAADILAARYGDSDLAVLMCVEQAATVDAFAGRLDRAVALGERADTIWRSYPDNARDALLAANTRRILAWYLELAGRHEQAATKYASALDEFLNLLGEEHYLVALTRSGLAVSLAGTGELERAERLSRQACHIADQTPTLPPDSGAHINFARGHVLWILGRPEQARPRLEQAWEGFYRDGAGNELPWRAVLVSDMAGVCEKLGDHAAAETWRRRAPHISPASGGG